MPPPHILVDMSRYRPSVFYPHTTWSLVEAYQDAASTATPIEPYLQRWLQRLEAQTLAPVLVKIVNWLYSLGRLTPESLARLVYFLINHANHMPRWRDLVWVALNTANQHQVNLKETSLVEAILRNEAERGRYKSLISFFERALADNIPLSASAYRHVLEACEAIGGPRAMIDRAAACFRYHIHLDPDCITDIIKAVANADDQQLVIDLLNLINRYPEFIPLEPVPFGMLIQTAASVGVHSRVTDLLEKAVHPFNLKLVSVHRQEAYYDELVRGLVEGVSPEEAFFTLDSMIRDRKVDSPALQAVAIMRTRTPDETLSWFSTWLDTNTDASPRTRYNLLVTLLMGFALLPNAPPIMDRLLELAHKFTLILTNEHDKLLLRAYALSGDSTKAMEVFQELLRRHVPISQKQLQQLLLASARDLDASMLNLVWTKHVPWYIKTFCCGQIHRDLLNSYLVALDLTNQVDMIRWVTRKYIIEPARLVSHFEELCEQYKPKRNNSHQYISAERVLTPRVPNHVLDMLPCPPNHDTFRYILTAFTKRGLFMEAMAVFHLMEHFEIKPNIKHYSLIFHALVFSGTIREMEYLMDRMTEDNVPIDAGIVADYMNGCLKFNNYRKILDIWDSVRSSNDGRFTDIQLVLALAACLEGGLYDEGKAILEDVATTDFSWTEKSLNQCLKFQLHVGTDKEILRTMQMMADRRFRVLDIKTPESMAAYINPVRLQSSLDDLTTWLDRSFPHFTREHFEALLRMAAEGQVQGMINSMLIWSPQDRQLRQRERELEREQEHNRQRERRALHNSRAPPAIEMDDSSQLSAAVMPSPTG